MNLPRELVADHLNVDWLSHAKPNRTYKVLINPRLKLTHPEKLGVSAVKRVKIVRNEVVSQSNLEHYIVNGNEIMTTDASTPKAMNWARD
jgi:hypothetical protein